MRVSTVALFLSGACLLCVGHASSQPLTGKLQKPPLVGRIEVDEHEQCFTVRFFITNATDKEIQVIYGSGDKGLEIVPLFNFGQGDDISISPPTYLKRPKQVLKPSVMPIPAGKEVLYGTFTMGYPRLEKETVDDLRMTINFRQPDTIVEAKPVRLKIPAQKTGAAAEQKVDSPGQWVNSDNGDLSLRLRVKSARIAPKDSLIAIAEIRNNRQGPVTILRPFGDHFVAEAVQLKIWGEQGQIKYTGPTADYDLNKNAFITLGAKEIATDTLELSVHHFAETGKAGKYTLRYDYAYDGTWDKKVAGEGVKGIWRGSICSREIRFQKIADAAAAPVEKPDRAKLDKDLNVLLSLAKTLEEKPNDPTALQDGAALAERLAPHLPGNRVVWQVLIKTRTLKDGMSLATAEKILGGPPTRTSDQEVGWYFNAAGRHVAPYLHAKVTKDGLVEWKLDNR